MARRELGQDEAALWSAFARDIQPLKSKRRPSRGRSADKVPVVPTQPAPESVSPATPNIVVRIAPVRRRTGIAVSGAQIEIGTRLPGLDDTSWKALSSGKMRPQRKIDLHGHFTQDAFERLHDFLLRSSAQGLRCVEVVTGVGSGRDGGVIRRELPHWLARGDLRPMILAVVHTHARNHGAVRILLRARRK
ncbi:Smr/MutS family protein [Kozakia baliensis]|uniref:Smr/MutS family protein n=1 Tax=Kozakia baliensis TaxID=153496 RepID=UPI000495B3EA|nr:Smr/MutS family protein [Kozakia baliensis]AOX19343.1 hypothetical protein A0U90_02485 [Kozakia baliensis]